MTRENRRKAKQAVFEELLAEGVAALHLDARAGGVHVPAHLRGREWLVLNWSYRYGVSDFAFDDSGVRASLSFGGCPHACEIPWDAVFGVTDDSRESGRFWPEDMPAELGELRRGLRGSLPAPAVAKREPRGIARSAQPAVPRHASPSRPASPFRLIEGGAAPQGDSAPPSPPSPPRFHLRRIK